MAVAWHTFSQPDALAAALAQQVAEALAAAVRQRGTAFLAVSGGTTPVRFFRALSSRPIDWDKVVVTLVDERLVPETSPRSNAGLVRNNLLQGNASAARFMPLFAPAADAEVAALAADKVLRAAPWPLDVAVLGMGGDGHTASFFPDATSLSGLLDPASDRLVLPVHAESAGEPRLTLSLPALVAAGLLVLHIEGDAKRAVLEEVLSGRPAPVGTVLAAAARPVEVFWAP